MTGGTNDPIVAAPISRIRAAIAGGRDPRSLVTPLWERAKALEPTLRAFAHLPEAAPEAPSTGPLAGVAVGVKDLIDTADMPTEYGSPIHAGRRPTADAEIVARLRSLGATVLGKTVTTEFAWRHPGPTRNPWNLEHTPGGSSSGSAAAVAAGIVTLALGTQTFGSIIRPAAFCGVVGFKPSFGALPRDGVHPLSSSLDHVGLFARTVDDVAIAFAMLAGQAEAPPPTRMAIDSLTIAALAPDPGQVSAGQAEAFGGALRRLTDLGARIETVDLTGLPDRLRSIADTIVAYEAARVFDELQIRFQDKMSMPLADLVHAGRAIAEASCREALEEREMLRATAAGRLRGFDCVLTVPATGEAPAGIAHTGDARFCVPWTVLGLPAVALPAGLGAAGLPIGLQLVGRFGGDRDLLALAAMLEKAGVFGEALPVPDL